MLTPHLLDKRGQTARPRSGFVWRTRWDGIRGSNIYFSAEVNQCFCLFGLFQRVQPPPIRNCRNQSERWILRNSFCDNLRKQQINTIGKTRNEACKTVADRTVSFRLQ